MTEVGCCFLVKQVELYVIKKTTGTDRERCRDEEHKLDIEEMVKTTDCMRTLAQEDASRNTLMQAEKNSVAEQ
jgi:hypothetical protein